jgi:transposase-like protein
MKKIILLFTLFIFSKAFSQSDFKHSVDGLNPKFLVIEIDSLNASELYLKTLDWIKETYKNPDEVIKAKFENEKIRFNGFQKSAMSTKMLGVPSFSDVRYSIEISFKDNKLKFEPINLERYTAPSEYVSGGWSFVPLNTGSYIYKKNGKSKGIFKRYPKQIENIFNNLKSSLEIYLLKQNNTIKDKKDDW